MAGTAGATLGRRDRKVAATRQSIVDAALSLIAEHGFNATTIEQITERADVGQRTFFRYFPTKESVVFADVEQKWDRAVAVLDDRPIDEPPFLSLRAALDELARLAAADVDSIRLRMRLADEHPAIANYHRELFAVRLGDRFASFVAERLGVDQTTDPRPGMWTALAMASFRIGFEQWLAHALVGDLHGFMDDAMTAAADAIRTMHAGTA
jgi:TetR/AcrR family transcriptional regulator, regulator of mycofactocin system